MIKSYGEEQKSFEFLIFIMTPNKSKLKELRGRKIVAFSFALRCNGEDGFKPCEEGSKPWEQGFYLRKNVSNVLEMLKKPRKEEKYSYIFLVLLGLFLIFIKIMSKGLILIFY